MKQVLLYAILLFPVTFTYISAEDEKIKLTEEQIQEMKDAEQKYKDNPYALRVIKQLKEATGITDEEQQTTAPVEPTMSAGQPEMIQGSRTTADDAYARGDYETAFEQYKALAEAGDSDASLMLGTMYEQGKGTDADKAAAHSWYKKSSEGGDERGEELMMLIEDTSMTEEDIVEADRHYEEISGQSEKSGTGETTRQTGGAGQMVATGSDIQAAYRHSEMVKTGAKPDSYETKKKLLMKWAPFVPVKETDPEYMKPVTVSISLQPDRFYRK